MSAETRAEGRIRNSWCQEWDPSGIRVGSVTGLQVPVLSGQCWAGCERKMADKDKDEMVGKDNEGAVTSSIESEQPDMMALLMAMLQETREETRRAREEAREEAQATREETQRAREEAREEAQERHEEVKETLRAGMQAAKEEACHYTDKQCGALRQEVQEVQGALRQEVQEVREELQGLRGELGAIKTEAVSPARAAETKMEDAVSLPARWGEWERAAPTAPWATFRPITPPPSPPRSSPREWAAGNQPAAFMPPHLMPPRLSSPPRAPPAHHQAASFGPSPQGKRKPSEFDGKVAWEAYLAQFEMLAAAQGWNDGECALQLVSSLRGQALEVLAHLTPAQRSVYSCVVGALERRFGQHLQAEVYRARLRGRVRGPGEPLPRLAQDVETLVRRAYPAATEEMVAALSQDYFVDSLRDRQLQLYIKQAHPKGVREALSRALEMEAFTRASDEEGSAPYRRGAARPVGPRRDVYVRRSQAETPRQERRASPDIFRGECWGCGARGHKRTQCKKGRKTRSLEDLQRPIFHPCCWRCGEMGHLAAACPKPKEITTPQENRQGLGAGAETQPSPPRGPHSM